MRRQKFLAEMDQLVPRARSITLIEPHYANKGRRGRTPMPLQSMLRIYFMQQWYAMSDPAMEDALYEIESMRRFAGLELIDDALSDESTILRFRHVLERHALTQQMLDTINICWRSEAHCSKVAQRSVSRSFMRRPRRRTGRRHVIRRCTRPRKANGGTSE